MTTLDTNSKPRTVKGGLKMRRILRNLPAGWLAAMVLIAIIAPFIAPYGFSQMDPIARFKPPVFADGSWEHILGTDQIGRDLLSRLFLAIRISLGIAFLGTVIGAIIGTFLGMLAARMGGVVDDIISSLVDFQASVPFVIFAIAALAVFDNNLVTFILILGVAGWERYARLVRSLVLSAQNDGYAEAQTAMGAPAWRIYLLHILPNVVGALSVQMTINFPETILLETGLSFLGLGVQPPNTSLGLLVSDGRPYIFQAWWLTLVPGAVIFVTTLCVSLLGDALHDRLDKSRH